MLLRNRQVRDNDQNWCVVLNSVASEIDKKKIAQKIADTFSLSSTEASDLVSNTPIILLDNLNRPLAAKAKEYFRVAGAEVILTNDMLRKRKFYRTVWPEPPNLSFLMNWEPAAVHPAVDENEALAPEEALHAIRSRNKTSDPSPSRDGVGASEDFERWKKECLALREEVAWLREEVDRRIKEQLSFQEKMVPPSELQDRERQIQDREREIQEIRRLLYETEERYRLLKSEYDEARALFGQKISETAQEATRWQRKFEEMNGSLQALQEEGRGAEERYRDLQKKHLAMLEDMEGRLRRAREWEVQVRAQETEIESLRREVAQVRERLAKQEMAGRASLEKGRAAEREEKLRRLVDEQRKMETEIREREEAIRRILEEQVSVERDMLREKGALPPRPEDARSR